jgi:penicillin amidase
VALAACLTGIDERGSKWMDAVLDMLLARSADDIESAVNEWTEPVNNYMYCDTAGEFGYRLRGRVPIRRDADQDDAGTWVPVPGYTSAHEWERHFDHLCGVFWLRFPYVLVKKYSGSKRRTRWERLIPPNELPSVRNPLNGYAVTCNHKVTTDDYPYTISQHYGSEMRAQRVTARIEQTPPGAMTVAQMGSIHKERVSISAQCVIKVCVS